MKTYDSQKQTGIRDASLRFETFCDDDMHLSLL
jgi:hypothetical protein